MTPPYWLRCYVPYSPTCDLGQAYNEVMESVPEGGWAALLDHDAMFTTSQWWHQIQGAIHADPTGTFTGYANRTGKMDPGTPDHPWQRLKQADRNNHDINYHRVLGKQVSGDHEIVNVTHAQLMGGFLIVISKETWRQIGGFEHGMRGVDYAMHLKLIEHKLPLYLIKCLYVYHWKRGDGSPTNDALPKCAYAWDRLSQWYKEHGLQIA